MYWKSILAALAFAVSASAAAASPTQVDDPAGVVRPAVVKITYQVVTRDRQGRQQIARVTGSGVIFDARGYIVTNQHVVEEADSEINVDLLDGRRFSGTVVGADELTDVAVVKIDASNLPLATFGDSSQVRVAQTVIAIGHTPLIANPTDGRAGEVVGLDGHMVFAGGAEHRDLVRTNIRIMPGDSGGALVDQNGQVVAMNVIRLPDYQSGRYVEGMHIPANRVQTIAAALIADGRVIRPYFGVVSVTLTRAVAQTYGLASDHGVLLEVVDRNGPAFAAGLRSGMIIQAVDGVQVTSQEQFNSMIDAWVPGQQVTVSALSGDGAPLSLLVTIAERE